MRAYSALPENPRVFSSTLQEVRSKLERDRGFALMEADFSAIEKIMKAFSQQGSGTNYASDSPVGARIARGEANVFPTYAALMEAADSNGNRWSYLSTEENYLFVRNLEIKGLVVPVVGDFAGPKALRAIGQYVKDHDAVVATFYTSNVEDFFLRPRPAQLNIVNGGWQAYMGNISSLPINDSSVFLRWETTQAPGRIATVRETLQAEKEGRIKTPQDLHKIR